MARPVSAETKHHVVSARLTSRQYIALAERAQQYRKTVSALLLDLIDGTPARTDASLRLSLKHALRREIDHLGCDLNAIAHAVNRDGGLPSDAALCIGRLNDILQPFLASVAGPRDHRLVLSRETYQSLNRIAVNLRQIADRLDRVTLMVPDAIVTLWCEITTCLDRADEAALHDRQDQ